MKRSLRETAAKVVDDFLSENLFLAAAAASSTVHALKKKAAADSKSDGLNLDGVKPNVSKPTALPKLKAKQV